MDESHRNITDAFRDQCSKTRVEPKASAQRDGMPLDEIIDMWYDHTRGTADEEFEQAARELYTANTARNANSDPESHTTIRDVDDPPASESTQEETRQHSKDDLLALKDYRKFVLDSPAYQWLLADIEKQCLLMPSTPDTAADIRNRILESLPQARRISQRRSPKPSKIVYVLPWDPIAFCEDQEYKEEASDVIARAITIAGLAGKSQALTTLQYLHQTWPWSGRRTFEIIQESLRLEPGLRAHGSLTDMTEVSVCFKRFDSSERTTLIVEATGTLFTLAEIGEVLAWIGASLRSSPYSDGVANIQPRILNIQTTHARSTVVENMNVADVICEFSFDTNRSPASSPTPDDVIVPGFPIARRPAQVEHITGLEISLHMMAGLALIKGFSIMLVPTYQHDDVIVWHLIHNKYGDRVSYLESASMAHLGQIFTKRLQSSRHILGWCTESKFLAGTQDANYKVTGSRLSRPRANCILQHVSISSGLVISEGSPFSIGYKDSPFHVSRSGYIRKLKWISRKFVIFWDEEAKRGWLVNGVSALLHLVRASLMHDSTDKFSSECLFRVEDMEEAPLHDAYKSDSAINVLLNRVNRSLKIYPDKGGYVLFEDRVDHVFNLLEQVIDHQLNVAGHNGAVLRAEDIPRAHLEGWDFQDLATYADPIYPRVATLGLNGKAWVELARSINAVTLLGRGFGEIISPVNQPCSQLATLPMGKYYLAASYTDLIDIMDSMGDSTASPPKFADHLVWLNSDVLKSGVPCKSPEHCEDEHNDVVQVVLPPGLVSPARVQQPLPVEEGRAVIFGYNENIPWFWEDTGDPIHGLPNSPGEEHSAPTAPSSCYGPGLRSRSEGGSESTQLLSVATRTTSDTTISTGIPPVSLSSAQLSTRSHALTLKAYTVGIVCALPLELLAVRALFDVTHIDDELAFPIEDSNHYALGEIGKHKVVAACLPDGEYGTNSAAEVSGNLKRTFRSIRFTLLVGIGGGVPSPTNDIRLGDIVVSKPTATTPGVIQYDMGKALDNGIFAHTHDGFLSSPPKLLLTALSKLRSDPYLPANPLQPHLDDIIACRREYRYPGAELDRLFVSEYPHDTSRTTCAGCDMSQIQPRAPRRNQHPHIHYGTIASANRVVRDARLRDRWGKQRNILCFEMEAAGVMNTLPCLVIRGVCDYADSHKNKHFQEYAAATAASYAKLLLSYVKDLRDLDLETEQDGSCDAGWDRAGEEEIEPVQGNAEEAVGLSREVGLFCTDR
ncbi:hypothetical protein BJY04DRAFT_230820 [Aspergillus karnatakaensis]|uniref:Pfs domain protein n=1 Tax=Aspergillus karnatakaensis TaxID=1810916 RepID=UPI003CCDDDA2